MSNSVFILEDVKLHLRFIIIRASCKYHVWCIVIYTFFF